MRGNMALAMYLLTHLDPYALYSTPYLHGMPAAIRTTTYYSRANIAETLSAICSPGIPQLVHHLPPHMPICALLSPYKSTCALFDSQTEGLLDALPSRPYAYIGPFYTPIHEPFQTSGPVAETLFEDLQQRHHGGISA